MCCAPCSAHKVSFPLLSGANCSKDSSPLVLASPCHPLQCLALSALASVPVLFQRSLVTSAKKEETSWRSLKRRTHSVTPITSQLLYPSSLLHFFLPFLLLLLLHLPPLLFFQTLSHSYPCLPRFSQQVALSCALVTMGSNILMATAPSGTSPLLHIGPSSS